MTRAEAQVFVARADDVCVSYVYDDSGDIVFRSPAKAVLPRVRRDEARRLLTVAATVPIMAAAACNHDATNPDAVTIAAAPASAAPCDDPVEGKQDEVNALKTSLNQAKDEQARAEIASRLALAQRQLRQLEGRSEPKNQMVAGKMKQSLRGKGGNSGSACNCPPNAPLCSCL